MAPQDPNNLSMPLIFGLFYTQVRWAAFWIVILLNLFGQGTSYCGECSLSKRLFEALRTDPSLSIIASKQTDIFFERIGMSMKAAEKVIRHPRYVPEMYQIIHPVTGEEALFFRVFSRKFRAKKEIHQFVVAFNPDTNEVVVHGYRIQEKLPRQLIRAVRDGQSARNARRPKQVTLQSEAKAQASLIGIAKRDLRSLFFKSKQQRRTVTTFDPKTKEHRERHTILTQL